MANGKYFKKKKGFKYYKFKGGARRSREYRKLKKFRGRYRLENEAELNRRYPPKWTHFPEQGGGRWVQNNGLPLRIRRVPIINRRTTLKAAASRLARRYKARKAARERVRLRTAKAKVPWINYGHRFKFGKKIKGIYGRSVDGILTGKDAYHRFNSTSSWKDIMANYKANPPRGRYNY